MDDVAEFRSKASAGGPLRHAFLIFPEDPDEPLSESVYDDVIRGPILAGREPCTIELVMEGADGLYDFIPVVSP